MKTAFQGSSLPVTSSAPAFAPKNWTMLIHPYNENWPRAFQQLEGVLMQVLTGLPYRIHHVGSTSVPGLAAKNIIDIDIEMAPETGLAEVAERLATIGYEHHGNFGIPLRDAFKLTGDSALVPAKIATTPHHLYVCPHDSPELARHLAFRDALRADGVLCKTYSDLKRKIAAASGQQRKLYAERKETAARAFIEGVLCAI